MDLVRDYPFTGSGLRSTMMVYSTYGMLIHVGFISHMHNLLLQIAVEQGVIASLAFVGLLAVAAASILGATRPGRRTWRFGLAAGAALAALVVHGIVDAGVYVSLMLPVLFLPIGFALAADQGGRIADPSSIDWPLADRAGLRSGPGFDCAASRRPRRLGSQPGRRSAARPSFPSTPGQPGLSRTSCGVHLRSI